MPIKNKEKLEALAAKLAKVPTSTPEYKNWMQRLDKAAKNGNLEAKYTLDKTIEYATANRKGYDGLQEFAMAATMGGVPGISSFAGSKFGEKYGTVGSIIGGVLGGFAGASHDVTNLPMILKSPKVKTEHQLWKEWLRSPQGRRLDFSNYGGEFINDVPYSRIGYKEVFDNLVDKDGFVNRESFNIFLNDAANSARRLGYTSIVNPKTIFNSGRQHSLHDHSLLSANTANTSPVPLGSNRQEFVRTALVHDIGKIANSDDHAKLGAEILKDLTNGDPSYNHTIYSVRNHMFPGNKSYFRNRGITHVENPNLTLGVMFADVANGGSFSSAGHKFPILAAYKKQNPTIIKYPEKWEDQLNYINRILHAYKYPKIKASSYEEASQKVNDAILRHNSFLRGVRDVSKDFNPDENSMRNKKNVLELLRRRRLDNTTENRLTIALEHIPLDPTGLGRQGLFDTDFDPRTMLTFHKPLNSYSDLYKISPSDMDALYVSASEDIADTYSAINKSRSGSGKASIVRRNVDLSSENLLERFVNNEFLILNSDKIKSGNGVISDWNKFKLPYMIQTGKPFSVNYQKFLDDYFSDIGVAKFERKSNLTPIEFISQHNIGEWDQIMKYLGLNSQIGKSPLYVKGSDDHFYWKDDKITSKFQQDIKNLYMEFLIKYNYLDADGVSNKYALNRIKKTYRDKVMKKIDEYYKSIKGKKIGSSIKLSKEYLSALKDKNLMKTFMDKSGLLTVENMPYFENNNMLIRSLGNWGHTPYNLEKTSMGSKPQLFIPGFKGERKLKVVRDLDLDNYNKKKNKTHRDDGNRSLIDGITRKSYGFGGKIKQAE